MPLIRRVIERVRHCALPCHMLFCADRLCSYIRAIRETFRGPVRTGAHRRPRLRPRCHICEIERRIIEGTPARVETLRRLSQGVGVLNTTYIERLNATFR